MGLVQAEYSTIGKLIQPGDIFAFGGKTPISIIIKKMSHSTVSHASIVIKAGDHPQIMDSDRPVGVLVRDLGERLQNYDGDIWWLPLGRKQQEKVSAKQEEFYNWCKAQVGKPYPTKKAIRSMIDTFDRLPVINRFTVNQESLDSLTCSELSAAALRHVGALCQINVSEVTPTDLCRFQLYQDNYFQIKGNYPTSIKYFNTYDPFDWNIRTGAARGMR